MKRALIAAALGIAVLAALAAPEIPCQFRFSRPISVQSPGWVKVPLDPVTRGHMTPDGRDLRIYSPSGEEVAYQLASPPVQSGAMQAKALAVSEAPGGWNLDFDLGPQAVAHSAFRFEFSNRVAASGCRLYSSADGSSWKPLASGDLFRIGESSSLSETLLSYAPSHGRYLRLWWPKGAGFPDVRNASAVAADVPAGPPQRLALHFTPDGQQRAGVNGYLITLPGQGVKVRRLELKWSGPAIAAYRLYLSGEGAWNVAAQGSLARGAGGGAYVSLWADLIPEGLIRAELSSGTIHAPVLESVAAELEPEWVFFSAQQAGTYEVAYGGAGMATPSYPELGSVPLETASVIGFGPEEERPLPEAPSRPAGLGAPLPNEPFECFWPVVAAGAKMGQLVRLEIPGEVYGAAQHSLRDLRLGSEGRQVPYVLYSPPSPALVAAVNGAAPVSTGKGKSEVVVQLPQNDLPLSCIEVYSKAAVFEKAASVEGVPEASMPGIEEGGDAFLTGGNFLCTGEQELPCRLGLCLDGSRGLKALKLVFQDGDNPPLPSVDVRVYRKRNFLLFFMPAKNVRLLAGAPALGQPVYDIAAMRDQLLSLPSRVVTLGAAGGGEEASEPAKVKWALAGILALAAIALAALLAKVIKNPRPER